MHKSQVKKVTSYAESSDDEKPFNYGSRTQTRRRGRARTVVKDEDEYDEDNAISPVDDDGTYQSELSFCRGLPLHTD